MAFVGLLLCFLVRTFASSPEENLDIGQRDAGTPTLVEGDIAVGQGSSFGSINSRLWDNGVFVNEMDPSLGNKYQLVGCFIDKKGKKKAIPYTGKRFKGPSAIPKCAEIAASKGYQFFAVQKRKCHTGSQAHLTYDKYGEAPSSQCKKGLGGRLRNSVYSFGQVTPPPPTGDCGISPMSRVIGGVNAQPGSWPWQIALLKGNRFICGGSLIKPDWVVTAAHCVASSFNPDHYQVRVGDHDRNRDEGTEQTLQVSKVISHAEYNKPVPINNDIALLQLKTPAALNDHVKTACLPDQDYDVPTSSKCFITGWGKIKHPGGSHPILQQAKLPPVTKDVCAKKLASSPGGSSLQITDHMLCAGKAGTILSGCHGDSGGPYVCQNTAGRWVLQGAVSWGSPRCAASERYTVFARVAKFRNWIDQHTGGIKPPSPPPPVTATPPKPGGCGARPHSRIVGGVAAKPGAWPWQAMLRSASNDAYCGGTLVALSWVVTATHCVKGEKPSKIFVRLGAHKRKSDVGTEQDFKVTKVITHEQYHKPNRYAHDIALLKLERPAELNDHVGLACLPFSVPAPADGDKCWITGWGTLSSGGANPKVLQQASVPVVSRARCDRAYPKQIHDSMICAGLDHGGTDACQGDSGGPMVCESGGKYYLQGATSWGHGCAVPGKFGVYAKVKYFTGWIIQKIRENS